MDIKDIELIPGMGLSLGAILKLMINYWNPSNSVHQQIRVNLSAALNSSNAADLCNILTGNAFAEAMLDAVHQLLIAKLQTITTALGSCTIECGKGGPSPVSVAKTVLDISVKAFDGDGVNFGALVAAIVQNIVCCALQLGTDYAIRQIGPARILGKLNERCHKLIDSLGSEQAGAAVNAASNAGYGLLEAAPQAQIDAAVQTMGASLATTAQAQATAVANQAAALRAATAAEAKRMLDWAVKDAQIYETEFLRLLAKGGNTPARTAELQSGLAVVQAQIAAKRAEIQVLLSPEERKAAALSEQAAGIQASGRAQAGTGVNWKPLLAAGGVAVVGSGLVLAAPLVIVGGAIALITGIWRRRTT